jgi:ribonuclease Y
MTEAILSIFVGLSGIAIGAFAMFFFKRAKDEQTKKSADVEAEKILNRARSEAQKLDRDARTRAKDFESRARKNAETEVQKQKQKLLQEEKTLQEKNERMDKEFQQKAVEVERRLQEVANRDQKMAVAEKRLESLEQDVQSRIGELKERLEQVARLSAEEAKRQLVEAMTENARQEAARKATEIEKEALREADKKAKRVLATAISRFASEYTPERTVAVISLPSEEMKGKIIGREGRNIRALEAACGVDLIVDETPESVVISSFDPVRREIARKALEKLMEDGRVHPARIEEVIEKVKKDVTKAIKEEGDKAVFEMGLAGLNGEIVRVLGGLKYRQSMGMSVLQHSLEVAQLAGLMAAELGEDVKRARRAGLLHDIGKGIDHTFEGSHAIAGAEFCKKYGETDAICHAIRAHHDEEPPQTVLAFLVQTANLLSNSRPGAKRPSIDTFIRRMEELESIGNSFEGVVRTYALQSGRDLRVMVEAARVTDDLAQMLSTDIARKIEREVSFQGQIKVHVVREVRVVEHAR